MRRVVVTGLGMVSPCGATAEATWRNLLEGRSGIDTIRGFDPKDHPSQIAGECTDFDPGLYFDKKKIRETTRFIQLAMGATHMAIESASLDPATIDPVRVGTFLGTGLLGLEMIEAMHTTLVERGPRRVSPYFIPATIANLAPGQISMRWGFRGPNFTTTSACASGAHAIGEATEWIRRGGCDVAVAGGTEATVTPLGVAGFTAMRALSKNNEEPAKASRPFDKNRDGFVVAEGAGTLILEELEHAKRRGATILAEVLGYGATSDAHHLTQPAPEGEGAQRAMRMALELGGIDPERINYVNAHATSTPTGDTQELLALRAVFKERFGDILISATKSMTGHTLGAAGAIEAAVSVLSIRDKRVHPTINLDDPEEAAEGAAIVTGAARDTELDVVLSNSFGFGGTNVTLAFAAYRG